MNILSKKEIELVMKFLSNNYPFKRLKVNGLFKRVILINNDSFLLNNKNSKNQLANELISIIRKVFAIDTIEATPLVKLYLNL